jgi:hypothetical protein
MEVLAGEIRIVFLASDADEHDGEEVTVTVGVEYPPNLTVTDVRDTLLSVIESIDAGGLG